MHPKVITHNEVYLLLVALVFSAYIFLLDTTFRKNKMHGFLSLIFPPFILIAAYKHWNETKNTLIYIGLGVVFISLLGLFTGNNYFGKLWSHVVKISLWQSYFIIWIYPKLRQVLP